MGTTGDLIKSARTGHTASRQSPVISNRLITEPAGYPANSRWPAWEVMAIPVEAFLYQQIRGLGQRSRSTRSRQSAQPKRPDAG